MNALRNKLLLTIVWVIVGGGMILGFNAYWKAWQKGFVIASGPAGPPPSPYTIKVREVPINKDMLTMILDAQDQCIYQCELWDNNDKMISSITWSEDSYRTQTARIRIVQLSPTDSEARVILDKDWWIATWHQGKWETWGSSKREVRE